MNQWIIGIPSEEQLEKHSSRLWLEKENGVLTRKIVELLPKQERINEGKAHHYYYKMFLIHEQGSKSWFFSMDEEYHISIECNQELIMEGKIVEDVDGTRTLIQIEEKKEMEMDPKERFDVCNEIAIIQKEIKEPNFFTLTLERKKAFLHRKEYCAIDEEGDKIYVEKNEDYQTSYPFPPNYTWWPKKVFLFQHDQIVATFNDITGEFGIGHVMIGKEPEIVWKYNKPKSKPTYFATLENKILL